MNLPVPERIAKLQRPRGAPVDGRARPLARGGGVRRLASWGRYVIGDTFSAANEGLKGRSSTTSPRSAAARPSTRSLDIVIDDELRTVLWPLPPDDDPEAGSCAPRRGTTRSC